MTPKGTGTGGEVLVVDDDRDVRALLGRSLEFEGFAARSARDARKARKVLARGRCDALIVDVSLPGAEDGVSLARWAQANGLGVVIVTGNHGIEAELAATGLPYLLKPFRLAALAETLRAALRARPAIA
jgi:DNA-binding response OmpR family regulator